MLCLAWWAVKSATRQGLAYFTVSSRGAIAASPGPLHQVHKEFKKELIGKRKTTINQKDGLWWLN